MLLHELFLLYRACGNEYTKTIKASAVAFGAEVDFDDDWYEPEPERAAGVAEISQFPISLGYEMVQ